MAADPDVKHFARLTDALHPWLDEVVIIGGWAHRLYRIHPLAQPLDYEPLGSSQDSRRMFQLCRERDARRAPACGGARDR